LTNYRKKRKIDPIKHVIYELYTGLGNDSGDKRSGQKIGR